jgi:hypothetical protein
MKKNINDETSDYKKINANKDDKNIDENKDNNNENIDEKIDDKKIDDKKIDDKKINEYINKNNELNKINKINVIESIKTNYLSWIFIILSIIIVSYPSVNAGFITFLIFLFLSYFVHLFTHRDKNIFTILHHYHHDNNNFFSHFSQILLELSLSSVVFILYYFNNIYLGNNYIDIWTGLSYLLFYSSVHNYNYSQLRVNDVHYLHHKNMYTNIGPDICDIAFGTKNPNNKEVENTNHYIPNVIISTIFILFIKYLCINKNVKDYLLNLFFITMTIIILFLLISSIYLYVNLK